MPPTIQQYLDTTRTSQATYGCQYARRSAVGGQGHKASLVSHLRDYDGLVYAQNWQLLRGDEQLDAARDA
ncbi:hypothetical protein FHX09_005752, partial [Rhizobium sp. BK538]|nr:hypothetical protein [Rhizobium sp. BK538]